jgi:hypothetical protein
VSSAPAGGDGRERHVFLALTNPTAGREQDFDRWYERHVEEVLERYIGFVSGRRYRASSYQVAGAPLPWSHLALYEVVAGDLDALHASNRAVLESGGLTPHDGAVAPGAAAWLYTALGGAELPPPDRHAYLALTNPVAGREAEFNAWYDGHHLGEIVEHTPGFTAGRRYERAGSQRHGQAPPWRYLALYRVDAEDIGASLEAIVPLIRERVFTSHRRTLAPDHASWSYTALGPASRGD